MVNWEEKFDEAKRQADRISVLSRIYEKIEDSMRWDCMVYHPSDEEHDSTWFTDYDEDDYHYERAVFEKEVYQDVLTAIEKLAK